MSIGRYVLEACNSWSEALLRLQFHQVEGQLAAFAEQLGASAPRGAAACRQLLTDSSDAASGAAAHSVQLSVRRSYRLVEHGAEDDDDSEHNVVTVWVDDWDAGAPWQPWASYTNPIGEAARALLSAALDVSGTLTRFSTLHLLQPRTWLHGHACQTACATTPQGAWSWI